MTVHHEPGVGRPVEQSWIDRQLLDEVGREFLRLRSQRWSMGQDTVLDQSAFRILGQLDRAGPTTLSQLSLDLQLEQSTVNRQVNAAIGRGLLSRASQAGHASKIIRPTPQGAEAFRHDSDILTSVFAEALGDVGPEVGLRLAEYLRQLNDAMDDHFAH